MGAMTVSELIEEGMTRKEAELEMTRRVFGNDVQFDRQGRALERGIGSAANPTENHFMALEKYEGKAAADAARAAAAKRKGA
jgi:hypothetical protein